MALTADKSMAPPFTVNTRKLHLGCWTLLRAAALTLCVSGWAQEKDFAAANPLTPESQFLDLIDLEEDPLKQTALLELFQKQFPKYEGMGAVYSQMQSNCIKLARFDRALELGDQLLKIDPGDLEAVKLNLEAAKGKNDPVLIRKWEERVLELTREPEGEVSASSTIATPFVEGAGQAGEAPIVGAVIPPSARRNAARLEAILFNRAVAESDPKRRVDAIRIFLKEFPQSVHVNKANYLHFLAVQQLGDRQAALALAEAILKRDQTREDVLLYAADEYFRAKRETRRTIEYATMAMDLVNGKLKPEGLTEEEWQRQRRAVNFHAHSIIGSIQMASENWQAADKELRAALAVGAAGPTTTAGMLTNLAWANYKMRRPLEAIKLYEQCAQIDSPHKEKALQSVKSIKSEYDLQ